MDRLTPLRSRACGLALLAGLISASSWAAPGDVKSAADTKATPASGPTAKPAQAGTVKPGNTNVGGKGGGLSTNGGNSAGTPSPKKPRCPDPTQCPAEKAVVAQ